MISTGCAVVQDNMDVSAGLICAVEETTRTALVSRIILQDLPVSGSTLASSPPAHAALSEFAAQLPVLGGWREWLQSWIGPLSLRRLLDDADFGSA